MSGVIDVGDAFELTFSTATGAYVLLSWLDPDQNPVIDQQEVAESPAGSGRFPVSLQPTSPDMWTAVFTASGAATQVERFYVRAEAPPVLPPLASLGDVSAQEPLTPAQEQVAVVLLRRASELVRSRFDVDTLMASGRLNRGVVALAVTNMVLRVLRNPKSLRSQTIGPFSRTFDTTHATGFLSITAAEEAMFTPKTLAVWTPPGSIRISPGLAPTRSYGCGGSSCGR